MARINPNYDAIDEELDNVTNMGLDHIKDAVDSLRVSLGASYTMVIAIAINPNSQKIVSISSSDGTPLGGYAYSDYDDLIYVRCVSYQKLGYIPCSLDLTSKDQSYWKTELPIPNNIIEEKLDEYQKENLEIFRRNNKDCIIEFLQIRD
jgi:hypothetical protein